MAPTDRIQRWLCLAILTLLGWLVYAHTLDVPFYFDDYPNIVESQGVHLSRLSLEGLHQAATDVWMRNRPLAYLSFALNFYLGRFQVAGYHLVNILLHLLAGGLLFALVRATLDLDRGSEPGHRNGIAFWAALIWLVHPIQTQAVTYIVQRMTVMAGCFYLLAMWCYVHGRRREPSRGRTAWFAAGVAAGLAAMASKEVALTLPGFILLYEWLFFQKGRVGWLRRAAVPIGVGLAALALVGLIYSRFDPLRAIAGSYHGRDFTLVQRLLTQPRVVLFYLGLVLAPHPDRLSLLHPLEYSNGWLDPPATLASALVLLLLLLLTGIWLVRRDRVAAFAVFWFLGQLVLESSLLGLEMIYEHRLYLPTMFLGLALCRLLERLTRRHAILAAFVIMGGICWVLGYWTVDRNQLWKDPVAFWRHTLAKVPDSARARSNLAAELMRRGAFREAIPLLERTVAEDPGAVAAMLNLAEAYTRTGADERAGRVYDRALALTDGRPEVLLQAGAWHAGQGRFERAEALLRRGLARRPRHAGLLNRLGTVYLAQGRNGEALRYFRQAVEADPGFAEAHDNIGQVLFAAGRHPDALEAFRRAVRLAPANPDVYYNLGHAYERLKRYAEAARQYEQVLRLAPQDGTVLYRAGLLYLLHLQQGERGLRLLRRALRAAPGHPLASAAEDLLQRARRAPAADRGDGTAT